MGETRHIHHLSGLTPEPAGAYLSALAVLRILAEQVDAETRGNWRGSHFVLSSGLEREALLDFFCQAWAPTPILSPWNKVSGFYPGNPGQFLEAVSATTDPRFADFRSAIRVVREVQSARGFLEAPPSASQKPAFFAALRSQWPASAARWVDAIVEVREQRLIYNWLLFNGGSDGKYELSRAYLSALRRTLLEPGEGGSRAFLGATLFDDPHPGVLHRESGGAFEPFTSEGFNQSSTAEGIRTSNPWRTMLALEGALLLKGADFREPAWGGSSCRLAVEMQRQDLYLPLWGSPLTLLELEQRLAQPRSFRAHVRYSVQARNGRSHFVIPEARVAWSGERVAPVLPGWARSAGTLEGVGRMKRYGDESAWLDRRWVEASDGSAEFGLALALSGLGRGGAAMELYLRSHLQAFSGPDFCSRMLRLLRHRVALSMLVTKTKRKRPRRPNDPLTSDAPARVADIASFLAGRVDERRLEILLHALSLVRAGPAVPEKPTTVATLPLVFRLCKLAFCQVKGDRRAPPVAVLRRLCEGRVEEAMLLAGAFLRPRHQDLVAVERALPLAPTQGRRVAAAMLFPISEQTYLDLYCSVKESTL